MGETAAKSLLTGLKGEKPENTINPEVFKNPEWGRKFSGKNQ